MFWRKVISSARMSRLFRRIAQPANTKSSSLAQPSWYILAGLQQIMRRAIQASHEGFEISEGDVHRLLLDVAYIIFGEAAEFCQPLLRVAIPLAEPF